MLKIEPNVWAGGKGSCDLQAVGTLEFLPHARMRSKGLCDRSWCLLSALFLEPNFYLSLSEVYFNTDRLLIEFNGLWYSLAMEADKCTFWVSDSVGLQPPTASDLRQRRTSTSDSIGPQPPTASDRTTISDSVGLQSPTAS